MSEMLSQYLISAHLDRQLLNNAEKSAYPYSLDAIKLFDEISFHPKVTFIIGENGTGKSTLLEAIAVRYGFNPEGGSKNLGFSTEDSHSSLYKKIRLAKGYKKAKDGYFLRAESFYNVASTIDQIDRHPDSVGKISEYYGGKSLHNQSHGESFMTLFTERMHGNGMYILDEPEAALSPKRQLECIKRMHELVRENSQFIIATHSPILLAHPNSKIIQITKSTMKEVSYEDTNHFITYKHFLTNYEAEMENFIL